jgi:hypothetical protein
MYQALLKGKFFVSFLELAVAKRDVTTHTRATMMGFEAMADPTLRLFKSINQSYHCANYIKKMFYF